MQVYADEQGWVGLKQWTTARVRDFKKSWTVSIRTAVKNLATIKAFFEYCIIEGQWIETNPARDVKFLKADMKRAQKDAQKSPFTVPRSRA